MNTAAAPIKTQAETLMDLFQSGSREDATRLCIASSVFIHRGISDKFQYHRFLDGSFLQRGFSSDLSDARILDEWNGGSIEYPVSNELYSFSVPSEQQCQVLRCREVVGRAVDDVIFLDPEFFIGESNFSPDKKFEGIAAEVEARLGGTGVDAYVGVWMCAVEFAHLRYWDRREIESDKKWETASPRSGAAG